MLSKLRDRLTYANVMASIAVFIALGAGAYAAGLERNSVMSNHIVNDQVKSVDVRDDTLDGGGLTGIDIREDTLGKVPQASSADNAQAAEQAGNADLLDNRESTNFVLRSQIVDGATSLASEPGQNYTAPILQIPDWGQVRLGCNGSTGSTPPSVGFNFTNQTGGALDLYEDRGGADPIYQRIPAGFNGYAVTQQVGDLATDRHVWQLVRDDGRVATITASVRIQETISTHTCHGAALALTSLPG